MHSAERWLCLLFGLLLVACIVPHANAQPFLTVPPPTLPGQNQILDFYAGGSSGDYSIQLSPQGGMLSVNDYLSMGLMPWGYVTTMWPTGRIYIIFLVNVTQTDFRIGYLYLTNSSTQGFILRLYDYANANVQLWTFQGVQHVYNRTVSSGNINLPKLEIPAAAKVTNGISALGPQLYLTSKYGEWLNGTTTLSIYPIYNQYFTGANDYNEVWSLLTDNSGNYYFAILYMPNFDKSEVIIEHQLRLNDYKALHGTTVSATWALGSFSNQVTVRTGVPNSNVTIDGFPFQTNQIGDFSTSVPTGYVTIQVPSEIAGPDDSKLIFNTWSMFGNENPLRILVNSTLDISAKYTTEYWVDVNSPYGAPKGSGWYPAGANVTYGVTSTIDLGNETRLLFTGWSGDSSSTSPQSWLTVNSAKQLTAVWQRQYALTFSAPGLPAGATTNVSVGDQTITLTGAAAVTEWVPADQQVTITVQKQHVQSPAGNYSFSELLADNQTFGGVVIVTQPITISLMYAAAQAPSPAPSINISPATTSSIRQNEMLSLLFGGSLLIERSIPPLAPMISMTATLAKVGDVLATMLIPGGPPIAGYLLGSLIIGLTYVLPVSALALLYRTARTKRTPNLRTLAPLAIVWGLALAIVLLSPNLGVLQSLVATLQILLMIATMLLFPLMIAFRLARLVA